MWDGNFSESLPGCGFYVVITHVVTVKSVFSVPLHIETCLLSNGKTEWFKLWVSCNIRESCVYNTGVYVPHATMENCPAKLLVQCFTHPTLSTAIFPTVSKQTRRVVTKDESSWWTFYMNYVCMMEGVILYFVVDDIDLLTCWACQCSSFQIWIYIVQ